MRPFAALLLAACDSGPGVDPGPDVESGLFVVLDDEVYSRSGAEVTPTFVNVSDYIVYVATRTFDTTLERMEGDRWVPLGPWYGVRPGQNGPRPVRPGFSAALPTLPVSAGVQPGTYRIRTRAYAGHLHWQYVLGGEAAAFESVSRPFDVTE